jgi:predicted RNA-binding protein with TRAM domain
VRTWRLAGLPLRVVMRGIRDALDAHDHGWSRDRKVKSLAYCKVAVETAGERWQRALALRGDERQDAVAALRAFASELEQARGLGARGKPLASSIAEELRERASAASLDEVTAWLREREDRLIGAIGDDLGGERLREIEADVDAGLERWRSRMPAKVVETLRRESLARRLLEDARAAAAEPVPPRGRGRFVSRRPGETPLRPGAVLEATVEKGVYRGRGLARHEGRVVFVPRAHPGDRVRARIGEVHAGWAEAALVEVLEPSPERRASPCPYVPRCGGCAYQDYDDAAELGLKESVLRESLARAGAAWEGEITRTPRRSAAGGYAPRSISRAALGARSWDCGRRARGA